jgi:hypothetical protein
MQIRRFSALLVTTFTLLAVASAAAFASGWHVVKSKSASGDFAVTAISASIKHPHKIAVRFTGGDGNAVWACDKGFSVSSYSREYKAGLHQLPHVKGKNSCDITASVGGEGRVRVQILKK